MPTLRLAICLTALFASFSASKSAIAVGYWNVPSTFCQCMGCGWGAGYHSPLVLGPVTCHGWCDHKEVRLPYAPAPPYSCYANGGCCYGQPTHLEAAVMPAPAGYGVPGAESAMPQ